MREKRIRRFIVAGLALLASTGARASSFELNPEFQSLTEVEQSAFEGPRRMEPEYQSDILTYTINEDWQYLWLSNRRAINLSAGSTSRTRFVLDRRIKVHAPLHEMLEFRFTSFEETGEERESEHHFFELVFWPKFLTSKVGISLYGQPEAYKRNDDTGVALIYKPQERHEIRLFNTFVDVTRLAKSDQSDTFIEPDLPYSRGLVGRIFSREPKADFLEYAFRHETKTRWSFPEKEYEHGYERYFGSLFGSMAVSELVRLSARAQYDWKSESRARTAAESTVRERDWLTKRAFLLVRSAFAQVGPWANWTVTPGIEYAHRDWDIDGETVIYSNLLPHAWLRLPSFGAGADEDFVDLGYEMTWHRSSGPKALRNVHDRTEAFHHRFNLGYSFVLGKQAEIRLMATADLDEFATKRTWEGGLGQFRLQF